MTTANPFVPSLLILIHLPSPFLVPEPVFVNVSGAQELIPLAYVAWRAGTTNRVVVPSRRLEFDSWAP
jgi:hypothetical protein